MSVVCCVCTCSVKLFVGPCSTSNHATSFFYKDRVLTGFHGPFNKDRVLIAPHGPFNYPHF
jgi:hypothetical protein